jgi:hypothetical protein
MSDNDSGSIHGASEGGVASKHPDVAPFQFFAAPATSGELNTARLRLIPVACWRVDQIRFAFDSSFVGPNITTELQMLVSLRETNKALDAGGKAQYPPLSVFGHADPVGSDDYNKALSGRRATAIYALLISGTESAKSVALWQQVAAAENWGTDQRQVMQTSTGQPGGTPDSSLFKAYMQKLCPPELQLTLKDFLAQGADGAGKGDYQGCSEFNPRLIFSRQEQTDFDQASDKTARNVANAPNRRVMVLLFRPGSKILTSKWPCPRATEDKTGCIKRFWSDGESRRSTHLANADRTFEETKDTYACRFYQRISDGSLCDTNVPLVHISVILFLNYPAGPLTNEKFRLSLNDRVVEGNTGSDGLVSQENIPSGDYRLEVANRVTYVSAIPLSMERLPWLLDVDAANGDAPPYPSGSAE